MNFTSMRSSQQRYRFFSTDLQSIKMLKPNQHNGPVLIYCDLKHKLMCFSAKATQCLFYNLHTYTRKKQNKTINSPLRGRQIVGKKKKEEVMPAWLSLFRHVPVSLALFSVFPQRQRPARFPRHDQREHAGRTTPAGESIIRMQTFFRGGG